MAKKLGCDFYVEDFLSTNPTYKGEKKIVLDMDYLHPDNSVALNAALIVDVMATDTTPLEEWSGKNCSLIGNVIQKDGRNWLEVAAIFSQQVRGTIKGD